MLAKKHLSSVKKIISYSGAGLLLSMVCQTNAYAGLDSIGAGVLFEQMPYKDYKRAVYPIPIISYDNDFIFLKGATAGIYAINNDKHELYFQVGYEPKEFKTSKTDNKALKQLDDRKLSFMAGVGYEYSDDWGNVYANLTSDVHTKNHGFIAELAYGYDIGFTRLFIEPKVGVEWQSGKYNNYYYGVSYNEAQRSGLDQYSAGSGFSPYLSVSARFFITEDWLLFGVARYTHLSSAIKDSPMTDRSGTTRFGLSVIYRF